MRLFHHHRQPANSAHALQPQGKLIRWARLYDALAGRLLQSSDATIAALSGAQAGDRVLDAGCGPGRLSLALKKQVGPSGEVHGIDASSEMIEVAKRKSVQKQVAVKFQAGSLEALPYPDEYFDVVVSRLVIHHLPGDLKQTAFEEMRRVLKPGGNCLVVDFQPPSGRLLKTVVSLLPGLRRMQGINVKTYIPLLEAAGFEEVTAGQTGHQLLAYVSGRASSKSDLEGGGLTGLL